MLQLVQIQKEQIDKKFLEDLHLSVFGESLPGEYFRFDLCLIAKNDNEDIVSYALVREINSETVELAWGGTSKEMRGIASKIAMDMFTEACLKYYPFVMFQTWNKNIPMIRLGLLNGYLITGLRTANNGDLYIIFTKGRE